MKAIKDFRSTSDFDREDKRRGTKLPPIKKSGKERHSLYGELEDDDELAELTASPRESVFDYFDDGEDDI